MQIKSALAAIACITILTTSASADTPVFPLQRPVERPLDKFLPDSGVKPDIKLPPIPELDDKGISSRLRIKVRKYEFIGNTVISSEELSKVLQEFNDKTIDAEQLQKIRQLITQHYIKKGYINSGAIIPDQKIDNGVIHFKIIEGRLTKINISGNSWLNSSYLESRAHLGNSGPLNVYVLRDQLFMLQQDPRIERLHARLSPGLRPGESILDISIEEAQLMNIGLAIDNYSPPSIGEGHGELVVQHQNLTGAGDRVDITYTHSRGLDGVSTAYEYPLSAKDNRLRISYAQSESLVVEEPFDILKIENRARTSTLAYIYPYHKTPNASYDISMQLEQRESQTFLLEEPFSFAAASPDGKTRLSIARMIFSWLKRTPQRVVSGRFTLSHGFDSNKATISDIEPDGEYVSSLGQFQWVERFAQQELVLRGALQLSDEPLVSMEQFAIGGARTVRGYRENYLVGDNGLAASVEYRFPVLSSYPDYGRFQLAWFADYGRVKNRDRVTPSPEEIYSSGVGFRWTNKKRVRLGLYWAEALKEVINPGTTLQDDGIHLRLEMPIY